MESPEKTPEPAADGQPGPTPKRKRVMSPESLKNLRRGVLPSERQLEGVPDGGAERLDSADGAVGPSPAREDLGGAGRLADMQHVYERKKGSGETPGQKVCRGWLEADPRGFMMALLKLEADLRVKEPAEEKVAELPPDEGEKRVVGLINRILAKAAEASPPPPR